MTSENDSETVLGTAASRPSASGASSNVLRFPGPTPKLREAFARHEREVETTYVTGFCALCGEPATPGMATCYRCRRGHLR